MNLRLTSIAAVLALTFPASAGEVIKANANATPLNAAGSWVSGGPPGPGDVAVWDATYAQISQMTMGDNLNWLGMRVANPATGTTVPQIRNSSGKTITLGGAGLDMSAATQNFYLDPNVTLGVSQTWSINSGRVLRLRNGIAGSGKTLAKTGAGTLSLEGAVGYEPNFQLDAGVLQGAAGTVVLSGTLSGSGGSLLVNSTGTLTLAGANTFSGGTTLQAGQLNLNHAAALGTGTLTITGGTLDNTSGGPLTLSGNSPQNWSGNFAYVGSAASLNLGPTAITLTGSPTVSVSANTLTLATAVTSQGSFTKGGAGTFELGAGSALSLGGQLTVSGGVLAVSAGGVATIAGATTLSGGSLTLAGGDLTTSGVVFGDLGTLLLNAGILTTGPLSRSAGTAKVVFNGGTLKAAAGSTAFLTGLSAANVGAGGARIDTNGNSITIAQPLLHDPALDAAADGGLALTGGGTLTLTGAATYTGPTLVTDGTLALGTGGSLASSPVIELAETGTFNGGTTGITLSAGQTLTGTGTLAGKLTVGAGATLAPGGPAAIGTLTGGADLALSGTAAFGIDKLGASLTHDAVVSDSVKYGGTLTVTATGAPLATGNSFKLFDAGTYSGSFATLNLPDVSGSGLFWDTSLLSVDGTLSLINHVPKPAFSPAGGGYIGAQSITISGLAGTTIHYTTDGSDPMISGTVQSGPSPQTGINVPVNATNFTIRAYASMSGFTPSPEVSAIYNTLDQGIWTNDTSGGTWSDPANWKLGAVGTGAGITADFSTLTLSGDGAVTLDSPRTLGNLKFGDLGNAFKWSLTGSSTLTLDTGTGTPVITVENQTATIAVPLTGTQGWIKNGLGALFLTASNSFTGGVTLTQGRLVHANTLATGSATTGAITVNSGGNDVELEFTAGVQNTGLATVSKPITIAAGTGTTTVSFNQANSFVNASMEIGKAVTLRTTGGGTQYGIMGSITGPGAGAGNNSVIFSNTLAPNYYYTAGYSGSGILPNTFAGNVRITGGGTTITQNLTYINAAYVNGAIPDTASVTVDAGSTWLMTWGDESIDALRGGGNVARGADGVVTLSMGTANGSGEFSGVISSILALTKTGTGTQKLAGANTYTGATAVNAGSLVVNGSLATATAVTVTASGTLGGTGTVAGTVSAAGSIAPGDNGAGTLTTGPATLSGTYRCQLDGANCDKLAVTGDLNLTGSTLVVSTINPPVPGPYVIATYTGTRTGTFATVPAGYTVDYATANQVKLIVSAASDPFGTWAAAMGLTGPAAAKGADPDGDGANNLMEFATNGNPNPATGGAASGPRVYPLMFAIGADQALTYTIAVRKGATFAAAGSNQTATRDQVRYTVEATNELVAWTVEPVIEVTGQTATDIRTALGAKITTPALGADWEWHTFRTAAGTATDPNDFIRLKVAEIAP